MAASLFDRIKVIDTDSHLCEPADLWTARVPRKWRDQVPRIERVGEKDLWMLGGDLIGMPGIFAMAGFDGTVPDCPDTFADIPPAAHDAKARLAHLDEEGIYAQVLYPNVGGFGSGRFLDMKDPALMLECVRVYNDYLVEWTREDPSRLVPIMATPFWDVAATVKEIERCAPLGHRGVLACAQPQAFGQPLLCDKHWDPIWAAAQDAGLSISFHIGGGDLSELTKDPARIGWKANFSKVSSTYFMENAKCIADLIFGGVCHRFPRLAFNSVESGAGWIQSCLEAFDWQWSNGGVRREHPEYDLLPSEYFRRQIYGCFWFEKQGIRTALEMFPDNMLYETDYPHPTCQAPGPQSVGVHPREYAEEALGMLPESTLRKVLHDNAAALYRLD